MARSDLLISLVRSAAAGDRDDARSTAEAIVAEERALKHHVLADRLERALSVPITSASPASFDRSQSSSINDAILDVRPQSRLSDLVLPLPVAESARQLIEEHVRADLLRAHGYEPRHRVLLSGPPGNGKTSFAEGIAEALALPLFVVRYDALIGSYLGETNARLRSLFDYVRTRPCVLFFDEFDAIGKERGDTHETGEIKRVVSFLLMQFDQLPSYVVVVTATNHPELLDRAVWRRFQLRLDFPAPDERNLGRYLDTIIASWPDKPSVSGHTLASELGKASYAEARDFCQNIRRRIILGLGSVGISDAVAQELALWRSRVTAGSMDAERSNQTVPQTAPRAPRSPRSRKAKKHSSSRRV